MGACGTWGASSATGYRASGGRRGRANLAWAAQATRGEPESVVRQLVTMRHPIVFILFGALVAVVVLYPIRVVGAADVANVRNFGATGNGTSNDTAAFERAMAQAARVGGVVYVPAPGNYRIANVTPPSNTRLQVQAGASLKKYGSDDIPLFNVHGPNDTTSVNNVH